MNRLPLLILTFVIRCAICADPAPQAAKESERDAPPGYRLKSIQGWRVCISEELLKQNASGTEKALEQVEKQLAELVRVVPAGPVIELRKVTLWFSPEYQGIQPRAEYHPDGGWLKAMHRNSAMAKGVEFTNVRIFDEEYQRMPCFVLHELAHAYHDRVLSFDDKAIIAAYNRAKESKSYEKVERWYGPKRPNTTERAYAMTNHKEYFAETTEAFFGRNDFFPFTREELAKHDPEMFTLLKKVWKDERPDASKEK